VPPKAARRCRRKVAAEATRRYAVAYYNSSHFLAREKIGDACRRAYRRQRHVDGLLAMRRSRRRACDQMPLVAAERVICLFATNALDVTCSAARDAARLRARASRAARRSSAAWRRAAVDGYASRWLIGIFVDDTAVPARLMHALFSHDGEFYSHSDSRRCYVVESRTRRCKELPVTYIEAGNIPPRLRQQRHAQCKSVAPRISP